jgi:CRISPR-associated exonuclease Cas4
MTPLVWAALVFFVAALVFFSLSGRSRKAAGLPGGRVIYTDSSAWGPVVEPLYDPVTQLSGRPDYLVQKGKAVIPVEVKSGRAPDAPYDSHIFQVAAYCLLVEKAYGQRPPYGIIHYGSRSFAVDYTPELENALLDLMTEMRRAERRTQVDRSHEQSFRCRGCGFAYTCEQQI